MNGPCRRCNGARKIVVQGVRGGKFYRKKVSCPDCVKPKETPR